LEPTRGPYRKPKNVMKKKKVLKNKKKRKKQKTNKSTEKQGRHNTLKLLKNM
jgi:hypothetical protein